MAIYTQLTSEQRYQIYALLKAEHTLTFIAEIIGKHKSTICREIARNSGGRGYRPIQAQRLCDQRKQGKYAGALLQVTGTWPSTFCVSTIGAPSKSVCA